MSRLIELVEDAQANQSKTQQMINDLAKIYTPVVISLAFLMMVSTAHTNAMHVCLLTNILECRQFLGHLGKKLDIFGQ